MRYYIHFVRGDVNTITTDGAGRRLVSCALAELCCIVSALLLARDLKFYIRLFESQQFLCADYVGRARFHHDVAIHSPQFFRCNRH